MTLEKLIQTLKESGQSIADSVMAPKELKITKDVVIAESIKLTSKDIYRAYWHCRDFEITHLWQRSVFLGLRLLGGGYAVCITNAYRYSFGYLLAYSPWSRYFYLPYRHGSLLVMDHDGQSFESMGRSLRMRHCGL